MKLEVVVIVVVVVVAVVETKVGMVLTSLRRKEVTTCTTHCSPVVT